MTSSRARTSVPPRPYTLTAASARAARGVGAAQVGSASAPRVHRVGHAFDGTEASGRRQWRHPASRHGGLPYRDRSYTGRPNPAHPDRTSPRSGNGPDAAQIENGSGAGQPSRRRRHRRRSRRRPRPPRRGRRGRPACPPRSTRPRRRCRAAVPGSTTRPGSPARRRDRPRRRCGTRRPSSACSRRASRPPATVATPSRTSTSRRPSRIAPVADAGRGHRVGDQHDTVRLPLPVAARRTNAGCRWCPSTISSQTDLGGGEAGADDRRGDDGAAGSWRCRDGSPSWRRRRSPRPSPRTSRRSGRWRR